MRDLVALDLPGGPAFVAALARAWEAGDAVLPLHHADPVTHRRTLAERLGATVVLDADGPHRLSGGRLVEPGDAVVVATSGTTGEPRGAVHTHAGIEYAAFATSTALGVDPDARWLGCLPLSHVGGLSVITRAMHTDAGLVVHPGFDAAAVDDAAAAGCTHTSLVPTVLPRIDARRWRRILLGGSAAPAPRPPNTVATYGMTETFGGVVYDGLALNGVEMRTAAGDDGSAGIVELRSPTLARALRDGDGERPLPLTDDGWYRTGDLGTIDPATGRLHVAGRADEVIVSGGEKVWPRPVELLLEEHPQVAEAAVLAREDPEWGQAVCAVVVPSDPAEPPSLEDLRAWVKQRMPAAAAPRHLELRDSLPRTSLGKLARHTLSG